MRFARAILSLLALLAAAGLAPAADGKVTLRLEVPDKSLRGMEPASEQAVLDAFLREHPDIRVEPYVRLRISGPRGEATKYMAMAGDTAPDALYVFGRETLKYIDQEFLYPLNKYLEDAPEITSEPLFQKFLPAISRVYRVDDYLKKHPGLRMEDLVKDPSKPLPEISRAGEGEIRLIFGITDKVYVSGLLYRKDLFVQAGLDPERPPKTWDELLEYARRLTLPERGQFGITLPGSQGASWRFANFVWQAGGEMCRQLPDGSWRLVVDEPAALKAAELYREMAWGKWTRDGKDLQGCLKVESAGQEMQHIIQGLAAMTVVSTRGDVGRYLQSGLDPSQVGLASLPAGPAGEASMLEGEFWGINNLIAADKARRDATWRYIKFLTGDKAKEIRTRAYVEAGWAISVNPMWLRKFGYESELRLMPKEWIGLYDKIVEVGRLEPYAPGYAQVSTDVLAQMDGFLYDEKGDVRQVMTSIAAEANTRHFGTAREESIRRHRPKARAVAGVLGAAAIVVVCLVVVRWARRQRARRELVAQHLIGAETPGKRALERKMEFLAWLFMLPAVLTILIWAYYPLVRGARLAFMDYRIIGESMFVGLDNFIEAMTQPSFWRAAVQTVIYAGLSLGLGFLIPIFLAVMLSEIPRLKMFFRTVFYLPAITSGLVVMFIWKMMYDNSERGIFNIGLMWLTGTTPGRIALIALVLLLWALATAMILGIFARLVQRHGTPMLWALPPAAVLATAAFFLGRADWATPIAFALHAAAALLAAVVFATVWLVVRRLNGEIERRHVFHAIAPALLAAGAVLAWQMSGALKPMDRPYAWLMDSSGYWAMIWVILPGIWGGMGPGCIIYLAALKSIPDDLYEAADVDGAGPVEKAYHVTFQYLKPLIIINFVGAFVGTFHAMQNILVMTGGGPGDRTVTLGMDIFFNAFTHLKFGYATAEAWILGSLLIGFTVYQLRILKQLRFTRAEN